ncbi:hypothetical protein PENTCL1PPCAC_14325 [Pristionchus entomophagus]|uniref:NR LBD domain-containing protein n=1 Tax=Pristionchus entomophagus TaxID=358040 RepID=A0AAV5T995_9BILA|nr:hypothetical protein PENTCL1PPCAC_14325 [Pristionchus entomophagus]
MRACDHERFFESCPDKIDKVKIIRYYNDHEAGMERICREVREHLDRSNKGDRRFFKLVKPTDYEFLALIGLALWNYEISNVNEKLLLLSLRNRAMIMRELYSYYAQQGKLDYAERIGQIYCVLVYFQSSVLKIDEDFQMFLLQGVYKEHFEIKFGRLCAINDK